MTRPEASSAHTRLSRFILACEVDALEEQSHLGVFRWRLFYRLFS